MKIYTIRLKMEIHGDNGVRVVIGNTMHDLTDEQAVKFLISLQNVLSDKYKPEFNTRQGQLTDADAMKGSPKGGRVWVVVDLDGVTESPNRLYSIENGVAHISGNIGFWRTDVVRLATPDELTAAGIDPVEAGVKE